MVSDPDQQLPEGMQCLADTRVKTTQPLSHVGDGPPPL
jgi:hypothetical protein